MVNILRLLHISFLLKKYIFINLLTFILPLEYSSTHLVQILVAGNKSYKIYKFEASSTRMATWI
jgi:hypothetical protein